MQTFLLMVEYFRGDLKNSVDEMIIIFLFSLYLLLFSFYQKSRQIPVICWFTSPVATTHKAGPNVIFVFHMSSKFVRTLASIILFLTGYILAGN